MQDNDDFNRLLNSAISDFLIMQETLGSSNDRDKGRATFYDMDIPSELMENMLGLTEGVVVDLDAEIVGDVALDNPLLHVKVKPLVWVECRVWGDEVRIKTTNGDYFVDGDDDRGWSMSTRNGLNCATGFPNMKAAQAAAQHIHDTLTLDALDIQPVWVSPEMVKAALESRAVFVDGEYATLFDLLGFSSENTAREVTKAALEAALREYRIVG